MNYIANLFFLYPTAVNVVKAILWTILMTMFTYTDMWVAIFKINIDAQITYYEEQGVLVGLIVNFGLVLMLVFDYVDTTDMPSKNNYVVYSIAMLFAVIVYAHCKIASYKKLDEFICPLSWEGMGFVIHIAFLVLLTRMKYCLLQEQGIKSINLITIK